MLGIPVTKGVFLFHNLVSLLGTDTQNIFSFFPLSSPPSPVPCCCCCCCCQVTSVVSNPVRPQRRQPTRLPRPWDSPGKNTGVGCHFLLRRMKVKSESEFAQLCPTLRNPMDCSLPGSSVHGISQARVLEWGAIAFSEHFYKYLYIWVTILLF